ncbi:hypothetical protein DFR68_110147 [Nocardia mexicana]|uniref:Uncharacterized protein n=1 Tax=Nocardia mexicana TaxID=279262 RepID=A0A370GTC2_9NOCA|nr:hypothetical protein DFR68_110147 [Nocardia mexicana]
MTECVRDAVDRSVAVGEGTAVVDAGSGIVQWLAAAEGVFHIEVVAPARHRHRTLRQRLRGRPEPDIPDFDERQLATLTDLGFRKARQDEVGRAPTQLRPHILRADDAGLDREHVVHVIVTVLHDIMEVRDASDISIEIF